MADEEINDSELDFELEEEKKPRRDQRVDNALSEKQKAEELAAKESKAREKAEKEAEAARKDLEFYKNFNTVSSKYQGASEYQDQIREKAALGLSLDEAAMLVLTQEGKYTPPTAPVEPPPSPVGGSAATQLKAGGDKPIGEMTQEERRAELVEAEKRGDIALN